MNSNQIRSFEWGRADDRVHAMRLGCLGCLGTIIGLVLLLCLAGGALWAWNGLYGVPPLLPSTPGRADPVAGGRKTAPSGPPGSRPPPPAPNWLLGLMLGSRGASLLRWQAPGVVDRLEIGEGRITIRTR